MAKTFRKLPIVTFDNARCDETCPQLKGFVTKCKIDGQVLKIDYINVTYPMISFDDGPVRFFLRTEECRRSEV